MSQKSAAEIIAEAFAVPDGHGPSDGVYWVPPDGHFATALERPELFLALPGLAEGELTPGSNRTHWRKR